jgi:hypothetical protein
MDSSIFCDMKQCSPLKVSRGFEGICRLHITSYCFMLLSCLAYSSSLKFEVTCSSEISIEFQQNIWVHIPEERTLQALNLLCIVTIYILSRDRITIEGFGLVIRFFGLLYSS